MQWLAQDHGLEADRQFAAARLASRSRWDVYFEPALFAQNGLVYNRADLLKTKDDLLITKQVQSKNYRVAFSDEDVDSEYKEV